MTLAQYNFLNRYTAMLYFLTCAEPDSWVDNLHVFISKCELQKWGHGGARF